MYVYDGYMVRSEWHISKLNDEHLAYGALRSARIRQLRRAIPNVILHLSSSTSD